MVALYGAAADIHRRTYPAIDSERETARGGARDVDDRVHGAHFVKMNFLDRNVMDPGLGLPKQAKGAKRQIADIGIQRRRRDEPLDFLERASVRVLSVRVIVLVGMIVMMMGVVVALGVGPLRSGVGAGSVTEAVAVRVAGLWLGILAAAVASKLRASAVPVAARSNGRVACRYPK